MEKFIIDTDPGIDDAQAILMAAAQPKVNIEAIMTVGGNVGLAHTLRNALTIVEVIGQTIPVYAGCDGPLVMPSENAAFVHGEDGLGDIGLRPQSAQAEMEHASVALVRLINESPNEYVLVALGPLTNIAVALKLDPDLPYKLKRFVDMGGAVTGKGNTSNVCAEFNIFADPEAALIVFEAWAAAGRLIEVVDWEATLRHGISPEVVQQWVTMQTPKAKFFAQITAKARVWGNEHWGDETFFSADPLAMAVALDPNCVLKTEEHYLRVEISGRYTRGQTIVDWQDRSNQAANASIILAVEQKQFQALIEQGLC